jgi:hypothetical protein
MYLSKDGTVELTKRLTLEFVKDVREMFGGLT